MNELATQQDFKKIRVWDTPTRIFHWVLALCFAVAIITQEMESLRLIHITCGYTMLGLVGFRLLWGVWGTRYARFKEFVPTPGSVLGYIKSIASGKPKSFLGHNPIGALAIIAMLALTVGSTASGTLLEQGFNEDLFEEIHEVLSNTLLFVVVGHLLGVLVSSVMHKENLVPAMISGRKLGSPAAEIRTNYTWVAAILAAAIGYFWIAQLGFVHAF